VTRVWFSIQLYGFHGKAIRFYPAAAQTTKYHVRNSDRIKILHTTVIVKIEDGPTGRFFAIVSWHVKKMSDAMLSFGAKQFL
jgi:hypothetical protein